MLSGFGNFHQSEAIPNSLPKEQNSPQRCPHGLFAEQLSGSAFTTPRHQNLHAWLYRITPSVVHSDYQLYPASLSFNKLKPQPPNPMRWLPQSINKKELDFIDSLTFVAGNILANTYLYNCTLSMQNRYFSNSDGELLIIPYLGEILISTEFGRLQIGPKQIAVIPRGIFFQIKLQEKNAAGYICENLKTPFRLPSLGPIGANGLANPRHFLYPQARFEETSGPVQLLCKYEDAIWEANALHSPLNVVAWQGNYAPYSYDLALFNTINSVSYDHCDPSIFTVLTSESTLPGIPNLDFVIFPPRWIVSEHTFRPPYFHRNIMNEYMGLIEGIYDAKAEGFSPGGISVHNCMTPHGPDQKTVLFGQNEILKPKVYRNTLAFMLESSKPWKISEKAYAHPTRDKNYTECWQGIVPDFKSILD